MEVKYSVKQFCDSIEEEVQMSSSLVTVETGS